LSLTAMRVAQSQCQLAKVPPVFAIATEMETTHLLQRVMTSILTARS
jgi:hypothetical protein